MTVEIWSDVACPFCFIGKAHFDQALEKFENKDDIEVVWRSFLLDPTLPEETEEDIYTSLAERKQMPKTQVMDMTAHVKSMADKVGIKMDFDRIKPVNTTKAHRVLQLSKIKGKGAEMKLNLLKAYFSEGLNIANREALVSVAERVGLDEKMVDEALTDQKYLDRVNHDLAEAREFRITGVPFFVIDRKYGISGAQPTAVFSENLSKAYAEWKTEKAEAQSKN